MDSSPSSSLLSAMRSANTKRGDARNAHSQSILNSGHHTPTLEWSYAVHDAVSPDLRAKIQTQHVLKPREHVAAEPPPSQRDGDRTDSRSSSKVRDPSDPIYTFLSILLSKAQVPVMERSVDDPALIAGDDGDGNDYDGNGVEPPRHPPRSDNLSLPPVAPLAAPSLRAADNLRDEWRRPPPHDTAPISTQDPVDVVRNDSESSMHPSDNGDDDEMNPSDTTVTALDIVSQNAELLLQEAHDLGISTPLSTRALLRLAEMADLAQTLFTAFPPEEHTNATKDIQLEVTEAPPVNNSAATPMLSQFTTGVGRRILSQTVVCLARQCFSSSDLHGDGVVDASTLPDLVFDVVSLCHSADEGPVVSDTNAATSYPPHLIAYVAQLQSYLTPGTTVTYHEFLCILKQDPVYQHLPPPYDYEYVIDELFVADMDLAAAIKRVLFDLSSYHVTDPSLAIIQKEHMIQFFSNLWNRFDKLFPASLHNHVTQVVNDVLARFPVIQTSTSHVNCSDFASVLRESQCVSLFPVRVDGPWCERVIDEAQGGSEGRLGDDTSANGSPLVSQQSQPTDRIGVISEDTLHDPPMAATKVPSLSHQVVLAVQRSYRVFYLTDKDERPRIPIPPDHILVADLSQFCDHIWRYLTSHCFPRAYRVRMYKAVIDTVERHQPGIEYSPSLALSLSHFIRIVQEGPWNHLLPLPSEAEMLANEIFSDDKHLEYVIKTVVVEMERSKHGKLNLEMDIYSFLSRVWKHCGKKLPSFVSILLLERIQDLKNFLSVDKQGVLMIDLVIFICGFVHDSWRQLLPRSKNTQQEENARFMLLETERAAATTAASVAEVPSSAPVESAVKVEEAAVPALPTQPSVATVDGDDKSSTMPPSLPLATSNSGRGDSKISFKKIDDLLAHMYRVEARTRLCLSAAELLDSACEEVSAIVLLYTLSIFSVDDNGETFRLEELDVVLLSLWDLCGVGSHPSKLLLFAKSHIRRILRLDVKSAIDDVKLSLISFLTLLNCKEIAPFFKSPSDEEQILMKTLKNNRCDTGVVFAACCAWNDMTNDAGGVNNVLIWTEMFFKKLWRRYACTTFLKKSFSSPIFPEHMLPLLSRQIKNITTERNLKETSNDKMMVCEEWIMYEWKRFLPESNCSAILSEMHRLRRLIYISQSKSYFVYSCAVRAFEKCDANKTGSVDCQILFDSILPFLNIFRVNKTYGMEIEKRLSRFVDKNGRVNLMDFLDAFLGPLSSDALYPRPSTIDAIINSIFGNDPDYCMSVKDYLQSIQRTGASSIPAASIVSIIQRLWTLRGQALPANLDDMLLDDAKDFIDKFCADRSGCISLVMLMEHLDMEPWTAYHPPSPPIKLHVLWTLYDAEAVEESTWQRYAQLAQETLASARRSDPMDLAIISDRLSSRSPVMDKIDTHLCLPSIDTATMKAAAYSPQMLCPILFRPMFDAVVWTCCGYSTSEEAAMECMRASAQRGQCPNCAVSIASMTKPFISDTNLQEIIRSTLSSEYQDWLSAQDIQRRRLDAQALLSPRPRIDHTPNPNRFIIPLNRLPPPPPVLGNDPSMKTWCTSQMDHLRQRQVVDAESVTHTGSTLRLDAWEVEEQRTVDAHNLLLYLKGLVEKSFGSHTSVVGSVIDEAVQRLTKVSLYADQATDQTETMPESITTTTTSVHSKSTLPFNTMDDLFGVSASADVVDDAPASSTYDIRVETVADQGEAPAPVNSTVVTVVSSAENVAVVAPVAAKEVTAPMSATAIATASPADTPKQSKPNYLKSKLHSYLQKYGI